jgi:hypothetical protein
MKNSLVMMYFTAAMTDKEDVVRWQAISTLKALSENWIGRIL